MMMIPFYEHQTELMRGFSQHQLDFPPHLHNCPELVRMRAGQLKVQINTQQHIVDPESLVIIFPNVISMHLLFPKEMICFCFSYFFQLSSSHVSSSKV